MTKLTISEAAKLKGVSISTLRRWELEGKIIPERIPNGHNSIFCQTFNIKNVKNNWRLGAATAQPNQILNKS